MSNRISFWLAWLMWVLFLVITFFSELLSFKNTPAMSPGDIIGNIFFDLVILVFFTVGAFIAFHRPQNPSAGSFALLRLSGCSVILRSNMRCIA